MHQTVGRQHGDRNFENDAVYVEAGQSIGRVVVVIVGIDGRLQHAAARRHAEVQRIESRAQVDEERVGNRSGENADTARQVIESCACSAA